MDINLLDCTLRDGGYYNGWDFDSRLVSDYLNSMKDCGVDVVEVGFRTLKDHGFFGPCAFSSDRFIEEISVPNGITIAVMVNASELLASGSIQEALENLFPRGASETLVQLVRIACHIHEFEAALEASLWLKNRGFLVGFNLMQISDRSNQEIISLASLASPYPIDVLYFADSMGSMSPEKASEIISSLRKGWSGPLGIHTHDNLGLGLSNTLRALEDGVTWVDSTVTGMGRGPGNARTEELAIEVAQIRGGEINLVPLLRAINEHFQPLKDTHRWGTNPFYYLAGKYGIHPSYIQYMLSDSRYDEADILAVIEYLRKEGGKKFSLDTLDASREFYNGAPSGQWDPQTLFKGKDVLLLGTGPGVTQHSKAIEDFIRSESPVVLALNTQSAVCPSLIDVRIACHPTRLLADCSEHVALPQPLITPLSMLPGDIQEALVDKEVFDFGILIESGVFRFGEQYCTLPSSLVLGYALAVLASGQAKRVLMAGFDGYGEDDPRNKEMNLVIKQYNEAPGAVPLMAVTPTRYDIVQRSVYGMIR